MKRRYVIFLVLSLFLVIQLLFINSFSIVLWRNGISKKDINVIDIGIDDNGLQFCVVKSSDLDKNIKLVYMTKKENRIWKADYILDRPSEETGLLEMRWTRVASVRRYSIEDDIPIEYETHLLYSGSNALKKIKLSDLGQLPDNVTVNIHQSEAEFTIHIIGYGDYTMLSDVHISESIKETGCIP